jgi:hypothetical protein
MILLTEGGKTKREDEYSGIGFSSEPVESSGLAATNGF